MLSLKFTWPWRILAMLAPSAAFLAAYLASGDPNVQSQQRCAIFFSVLAAANGYTLASAIGDLGRSILAIPFGMFFGFIAAYCVLDPLGFSFARLCVWAVLVRLGWACNGRDKFAS